MIKHAASSDNDAWVCTQMGVKFWPLAPQAEDVKFMDVAHALALQCRFAGHCDKFYSVAEHCILASKLVQHWGGTVEEQLDALFHDSTEAYLVDIPRPLKRHPDFAHYLEAEAELHKVLAGVFGLPEKITDITKRADFTMLGLEAHSIMRNKHPEWTIPDFPDLHAFKPQCWTPEMARVRFLARAVRLGVKPDGN